MINFLEKGDRMIWVGIGAGGFLGAVLRYSICSGFHQQGILIANILGCFILAFIFGIQPRLNKYLELGIKTGFCGALTTFSTFTLEVYEHYIQKDGIALYILLGTGMPLMAVILGYKTSVWLKSIQAGDYR